MAEWGFEPGIMFTCPKCHKKNFIETMSLRELWDDDEGAVRQLLGLEPWVGMEEEQFDLLALIPVWVSCPKCHKRATIVELADEDDEVEESGYGGTGVVLS